MVEQDIRVQLARIEQELISLRSVLAQYLAMLKDQETRIREVERCTVQVTERLDAQVQANTSLRNEIDALGRRINTWSAGNSFASIIAGILAWFR